MPGTLLSSSGKNVPRSLFGRQEKDTTGAMAPVDTALGTPGIEQSEFFVSFCISCKF